METRYGISKPKDEFGPLAGVRVINTASSVAGPLPAALMADWGADVIWIENPKVPDITRGNLSPQDNRRNMRNLCMDIRSEKGREAFLKLVEDADILIESSKGGTFEKWGFGDDFLWDLNPRLVIYHFSGFGQYGDPNYYNRASYDAIGQAFSGYMAFQGYADRPAPPAMPWSGDLIPPGIGCAAILAALYKASKSGKGESIDMSQYEGLLRLQNEHPLNYLNMGKDITERIRPGDRSYYGGWGNFECKDGRVYIAAMGVAGMKGLIELLGLEYGTDLFPEGVQWITIDEPGWEVLNNALEEKLPEMTMQEVDEVFTAMNISVSPIYTYADMVDHPHFIARENFIEWDAIAGPFENGKVKGVNIVPKFKNNPGKIVRAAVTAGYDNEEILGELGYSEDEIKGMYDDKAIGTNDAMHWF